MKAAILTTRERLEGYSDFDMIPKELELIHIGRDFTSEAVLDRAADAEYIVVDAMMPLEGGLIRAMPKLKLIHSEGVGYNFIDLDAAREAGVYVCNNRGVNAGQVAEHAVMLMLAVMRNITLGDSMTRAGREDEVKKNLVVEGLMDLIDAKVGIVGFGACGRELAKRLAGFGCKVFYNDAVRADEKTELALGARYMELNELLGTCDVISLHVPALDSTHHLIRRETIALMKKNAVIVNCARGSVVNSADLADAIREGRIYGAGLDTTEPEPLAEGDPLLALPESCAQRVIFTPHIAGTTASVFRAAYRCIWGNISAVIAGQRPQNVVNGL